SVAAHRVSGDRSPALIEPVAARNVCPSLECIGPRLSVIPAIGAAALRRDHDRSGATLAELGLVATVPELVVARAQRVEQKGHAVAVARSWASRNVDRVRLKRPPKLAAAVGGLAAQLRVVRALAVVEVANQDAIHRPGCRDA